MPSTALGTEDRTVIQRSKNTYSDRVYILDLCVCLSVHVRYLVSLMISWPISNPSITPQLYFSRKNLDQ